MLSHAGRCLSYKPNFGPPRVYWTSAKVPSPGFVVLGLAIISPRRQSRRHAANRFWMSWSSEMYATSDKASVVGPVHEFAVELGACSGPTPYCSGHQRVNF